MTNEIELSTPTPPAPRAEVTAVPFLDGHIPCVEVDGDPMVILRPIAEAVMGLRWAPQHAKITADQTACVSFIVTQLPGDTQSRRHMGVSLETFTIWLASLQPSRVSGAARETVIRYKREAGRALRDHFFGQPKQDLDEIEVAERYLATLKTNKALAAENTELRDDNEFLSPRAEAWDEFVDARGLISPAVFAQQTRITRPNGRLLGQNTAIQALRDLGVLKDAPGTDRHNTPYQEHAHRIVTRPERRGAQVVQVPYVVPSHAPYLSDRIRQHLYPGVDRLPVGRYGQLRAIEGGA